MTIAAPKPSISRRTRKQPTMGNWDTRPPVNGTGPPVKRISGRDDRPEGTRPHVNPRAQELYEELRQARGRLPGGIDGNCPFYITTK